MLRYACLLRRLFYGVTAYSAKRRTHEIGIRMALGAHPAEIRRSILRDSLAALAAGLSIGVAATLVATRALDSVLFGLSRNDPATLLAAACVLSAVAMLAAYLPAERAARSDPLQAPAAVTRQDCSARVTSRP